MRMQLMQYDDMLATLLIVAIRLMSLSVLSSWPTPNTRTDAYVSFPGSCFVHSGQMYDILLLSRFARVLTLAGLLSFVCLLAFAFDGMFVRVCIWCSVLTVRPRVWLRL